MNLGLKGKKALVTGGASGIGGAVVRALAQEGAKVVFTSRSEQACRSNLERLGGEESGHRFIVCNLADDGVPEQVAHRIWDEFGEIDIVVNNVGDTLGIIDPHCPISDWRRIFRLNLEVHVEINNLFIPHMKSQKWGRICNISANASLENSGPVPYCSIKAAYTAYTRCTARILGPDHIVMTAVLPGVVLTENGHWQRVLKERPEHAEQYLAERTSLGRFGTPEEIAPMVLFLCSEQATFCQGSIVPVEGGQARHFFAGNLGAFQ
jgi:3-oxoacyl-[acyl-carrier protein] reductase